MKEIYLAGGCFWGTEKAFKLLSGIISTTVGYANGNTINPTYKEVCTNTTGFKECVKIIYNENEISLKKILKAYFLIIDPEVKNRQKEDIGTQYQTGIYYKDSNDLKDIEEIYNTEKNKHDKFYVELSPLKNFYDAEEYHQDYLDKNPNGYCHITKIEYEKIIKLNNEE
jgi:peptide methionine sulfoxide reductase msrA/msrB